MAIPGQNLLNTALRVIAKQQFSYYAYISRALGATGLWTASYAAPITISGSVQPVPRTLYENMGLNFQRNYMNFYTPNNIFDVDRDVAGDQFIFQGNSYQAISKTAWFGVDGWVAVLAVQIPTQGQ